MRYQMILALFASLVVATTHAGECVTTEDWYVSVEMLPVVHGSCCRTSDPGKACMTYAEVS